MTCEKFESEIKTLKKFFEIYCNNKHQNITTKEYKIPYKDKIFDIEISLCNNCNQLYLDAIKHLQECPHQEKPRCRKCPNPCYNKDEWKNIAKIMKYGGIKMGIGKIGNRLKKLFN